jgi:hypothetical protein
MLGRDGRTRCAERVLTEVNEDNEGLQLRENITRLFSISVCKPTFPAISPKAFCRAYDRGLSKFHRAQTNQRLCLAQILAHQGCH